MLIIDLNERIGQEIISAFIINEKGQLSLCNRMNFNYGVDEENEDGKVSKSFQED